MDSNNNLCAYCTKALAIDDNLAGGVERATADGSTTLDIGNFRVSNMTDVRAFSDSDPCYHGVLKDASGDISGWSLSWQDTSSGEGAQERTVFTSQKERALYPPLLSDQLPPTDGGVECCFCTRLKELLLQNYKNCSWWNSPNSTIYMQVRYEWTQLRHTLWDEEIVNPGPSKPWQNDQQLDCLNILLQHPGHGKNETDMFQFDVVASPGICRDWLKIRFNPLDPEGPLSSQNMLFIKERIADCVEKHPICQSNFSGRNFFPTRLLDIQSDGSPRVWLVDRDYLQSLQKSSTKPIDFELKYATLSYCWGGSVPYKTTKGEVERSYIEEGIPINKLPATIRDAVYVTRKLGIRYLWVDAFCILQGDKEDWEAESAQMCKVFASSYITICAARASSSLDGFLYPRKKSWLDLPFQSTINQAVSGQYSILLGGRTPDPMEYDIGESSWRSRGWVWQEEINSQRLLIFGEKMIQFRCDTGYTLEYGYVGHLESSSISLNSKTNYKRFWDDALRSYSPRRLTIAQDRLSAVAGVVKSIQTISEEAGRPVEYIAGIWLDDILMGWLRWVCFEPTMTRAGMMEAFTNPVNYIAPSWSWASRNIHVMPCFPSKNLKDRFRIASHDVQPAHSDPTVAVKFGSSLTIQGKCLQTPTSPANGTLREDGWEYTRWETSSDMGLIDFWLDWVLDSEDKSIASNLELLLLAEDPDRRTAAFTGPKYWWRCTSTGLLLLPFQGPQGKAYHRVGVFRHFGSMELFDSVQESNVTIF